jgi:hypothetical protein
MQLPSAVELDPPSQVGHLDRGATAAVSAALLRPWGCDEEDALAAERVGQRGQCPDGLQLAACPIDVGGKALRAPARREWVRAAPGTLEEPGA